MCYKTEVYSYDHKGQDLLRESEGGVRRPVIVVSYIITALSPTCDTELSNAKGSKCKRR